MKRFVALLLFPIAAFGAQTISTPTTFLNSAPITINTGGALTIQSGVTINFGTNRLLNVGTPTANSDAATKLYVDTAVSGGGVAWGGITGTLSAQTDLQSALNAKQNTITPGALTKTNDTNVTLTLGGTPATALLQATSLTLGWNGQLAVGRGGTGVSSLGDITKSDDTNVTLTLGGAPTGALITSTSFTLGWSGQLAIARGGTNSGTASGARTNLGATTVGANIFTVPDPSAIRFLKVNADNTVTLENAATMLSDLGGGAGGGTVTSFSSGNLSPLFTTSVSNATTTPALSFTLSNAAANSVLSNNTSGSAVPAYVTNPGFTKIANLTSNGFVKTGSSDGTLSIDTSTYITGNQTITLSGDVTGSGTTAITTVLGNIPDATTAAGSILFTDIAAPSSPSASHLKIFGDSTDLRFHDKNAAGTIGTTVVSDTGSSNNFLTAISAAGAISKAQPNFTNLSGFATTAQGGLKTGGTTGQILSKASNADYDQSWITAGGGSGTVTNIATTSPITGGPITTTGTIALNVGVDFAFTSAQSISLDNASTTTVDDLFTLTHTSSGTPSAGFGSGIKFKLETSTSTRDAAQILTRWTNAADGTRNSRLDIYLESNAGASLTKVATFGELGELAIGSSSVITGLAGVISADSGFAVNGTKPTVGSFLLASASLDKYKDSPYLVPIAAGTSNKVWQSNGTNIVSQFLLGTITNDNAPSGGVGQEVESLIASGSAVSLTTATAANVTSISLTAGDWDVEGNVNFTETTSTVTARSAGVTSTSATVPTDGSEAFCGVQSTVTSETNSITLPRKRFSLSGTTTVYLVAKATFSAGTCAGFGAITARRVR